MKYEDLMKILNYSKERNQQIEERQQLRQVYAEIGIEVCENE